MSLHAIHHEPGVHEDLHPHICGANMRSQKPIYMVVGRIFSRGALWDLSKIFLGGQKVVKFDFSHSKLRKQPFLLKFSKSRGPRSPCAPFRRSCSYIRNLCEFLRTNYIAFPNGGQWAPYSNVCTPWLKPLVTTLSAATGSTREHCSPNFLCSPKFYVLKISC